MRRAIVKKHFGYAGPDIKGTSTGIDKKENILVVYCSNCGDYSRIDLSKVKEVTK